MAKEKQDKKSEGWNPRPMPKMPSEPPPGGRTDKKSQGWGG